MSKETIKKILHGGLPVPRIIRPGIRMMYKLGVLIYEGTVFLRKLLIVEPLFRSVACSVGPGLRIERIPYIRGQGIITVGSNVYISGKIGISFSSHPQKLPEFHVGDRSFIGHQCSFSMAKGITIGSDCLIAGGVSIQDNDGHPIDANLRHYGKSVNMDDVREVIIENGAWIASHVIILKGVKIGTNAVVGAGSVVTADIPANTIAAGNPARVIRSLAG